MNFFRNLLSTNTTNEESIIDWIPLNDIAQLDEIAKNSSNKTQVIFKHSTRCGISRNVLRKFEQQFDTDSSAELHFLDLLNHRDISNKIAQQFSVEHQSPQLLVIKNGAVEAHASHYDITEVKF